MTTRAEQRAYRRTLAITRGITIGLLLFISIFAGYWWFISGPAFVSCDRGGAGVYGGCANIVAWHTPCGIVAVVALISGLILIARVAP